MNILHIVKMKTYSIFIFNLRIVDSEVSFKLSHLAMLMEVSEKLLNNVTCVFRVGIVCVLEGDEIDKLYFLAMFVHLCFCQID